MVPAAGLDLSGAEVSVAWRATGVHRALALDGDEVWCWNLAAAEPGWAVVAGTFRTPVDSAERAALVALAVEDGTDGAGPVLLLGRGPRTVQVAPGSALGGRVAATTAPLLARALDTPVAAVRVRAGVVAPPVGGPVLGLRFTSVGTAPVTVRLAADRVRLAWPDGRWHAVPASAMGLVGPDGDLLDGLHRPARIPAGTTGAWVLSPGAVPGADRVLVDGTVTVAGPVPPVAVPFALVAALNGGP